MKRILHDGCSDGLAVLESFGLSKVYSCVYLLGSRATLLFYQQINHFISSFLQSIPRDKQTHKGFCLVLPIFTTAVLKTFESRKMKICKKFHDWRRSDGR